LIGAVSVAPLPTEGSNSPSLLKMSSWEGMVTVPGAGGVSVVEVTSVVVEVTGFVGVPELGALAGAPVTGGVVPFPDGLFNFSRDFYWATLARIVALRRQWVDSLNKASVSGGRAEREKVSRSSLFRRRAQASLHISGTPSHVPPSEPYRGPQETMGNHPPQLF